MNKKGHVLNGVLLSFGIGFVIMPLGPDATLADVQNTVLAIVKVFVPIVLGTLFPDVDTAFGKHRKTLHNLLVLGIFGAYPYFFDNLHFVWIGIVTHYVLDMVGSKRGIALFYPYKKEYGLPLGVTVSSDYAGIYTVLISVIEVAVFTILVYEVPGAIEFSRAALGFGI